MKPTILMLSCEHAVNVIPPEYAFLISDPSILHSPAAIDAGALDITLALSQNLHCNYTYPKVSHLLIDCNRALTHSRCFSTYSRALDSAQKTQLINDYYLPFQEETSKMVQFHLDNNQQVLHLSIHTFAATVTEHNHTAALGLSYDSHRHGEKEVARLWNGLLLQQTPPYRIRLNYPYPGTMFSFPSSLRKKYPECDYLGLELEINQDLLINSADKNDLIHALSLSLNELLNLL